MPEILTVSKILGDAWREVKATSGDTEGHHSRRVFADSDRSVVVGLRNPGGLVDLTFAIERKLARQYTFVSESKGFKVDVETKKGSKNVVVRVALTHTGFADLFSTLATDVVKHFLAAASDSEAAITLCDRLEHWRRFAEKTGKEGLSLNEQTGLFGELLFLEKLLNADFDPLSILRCWHGPLRANQDFGFGCVAVEVKTSISNTPNIVTVSNVRQLDGTGVSHLFLYHVSLDRREGSGATLPDLISELLVKIGKGNCSVTDLFYERLSQLHYLEEQKHLYECHGYTERFHNFYQVESGFPRIVESDLRDGVNEARYIIDLGVAAEHKVEFDQVISEIPES